MWHIFDNSLFAFDGSSPLWASWFPYAFVKALMHLFAFAGSSLWPSWIPYALVKALTTDSAAAELAAALAAAAADMMMSMTKFGSSSVPASGATGGAELPLPLEAFCGSSLKRGGGLAALGGLVDFCFLHPSKFQVQHPTCMWTYCWWICQQWRGLVCGLTAGGFASSGAFPHV